jgi:hypothetical protein
MNVEKDRVIFSVHSPFGLSHALIERADKTWPDAVVLRLHLKGLEKFQVANGKVRLESSVSIREGKPLVRVWKDGKEDMPLNAKSPYWIPVRVLDGEGKPAKEMALKSGYFEMHLPRTLFDDNPTTITLNWIDFYRN